jgi:predicted nuclease of restriction endonuclease-like (RecB) superfamily
MAISKNKYGKWLADLKQNINQQQLQTALQVNSNMLVVYWYLGKEINEKIVNEGWGKGVVAQLSNDLKNSFSTTKGYSVRSLEYMQQFAKEYPNLLIPQQAVAELKTIKNLIPQQAAAELDLKKSESKNNKNSITQQAATLIKNSKISIPQQLAAELKNTLVPQPIAQIGKITYIIENPLFISIPWGHHMLLLDKIKEENERIWYIEKTVNNNWSRNVLQYQIDTDLYTRQYKKKKSTNFHLILPKLQSDLANEIIKDTYALEFIGAKEKLSERQLEEKIIHHIEEFLIELGAGFAFVGRQYKLKVGRKEYFIDLLFYHLHLRSYVVIELKMGEFEMAHTGQMNGYLNFINKRVKNEFDNPTIGIILCGSKDAVEVDFALENINHPIGVSDYQFKKSLPKNLKDKLPSAKQLQDEVKKFFNKKEIKTQGKA